MSSVAVPARSRWRTWIPLTVPVGLIVVSGNASPGTWTLIVNDARRADEVVKPRLSVAWTENVYVPGLRLNGVVQVQL